MSSQLSAQPTAAPVPTTVQRAAAAAARPNVFVVGDAKCGTTSLYFLFAATRGIGMPRRKEMHFFAAPELLERVSGPGDDGIADRLIRDEGSYLEQYAEVDPRLPAIVDISPSYLRSSDAPGRIRAFAPDARIVILLREPAAKVFSQYVHLWTKRQETLEFEEAFARSAERRAAGYSDMFDYEGGGWYSAAVGRYLETFGADRVLVILFEELVGATDRVKARLGAFLGVDLPPGPLMKANIGGRVRNPVLAAFLDNPRMRRVRRALLPPALRGRLAAAVRTRVAIDKPVLAPETQSALRRRYAEDVAALEAMLGRRTGWPIA